MFSLSQKDQKQGVLQPYHQTTYSACTHAAKEMQAATENCAAARDERGGRASEASKIADDEGLVLQAEATINRHYDSKHKTNPR